MAKGLLEQCGGPRGITVRMSLGKGGGVGLAEQLEANRDAGASNTNHSSPAPEYGLLSLWMFIRTWRLGCGFRDPSFLGPGSSTRPFDAHR